MGRWGSGGVGGMSGACARAPPQHTRSAACDIGAAGWLLCRHHTFTQHMCGLPPAAQRPGMSWLLCMLCLAV